MIDPFPTGYQIHSTDPYYKFFIFLFFLTDHYYLIMQSELLQNLDVDMLHFYTQEFGFVFFVSKMLLS